MTQLKEVLVVSLATWRLLCSSSALAEDKLSAPGVPVGHETPATPMQEAEAMVETSLLVEKSPAEDWVFFSAKTDSSLEQTWRIEIDAATQQPILICSGDPLGYLKTKARFEDFELGLEWKYPVDPQGNSGVFLFTSGDDRIWPTGIQVQLHQPAAGSIFTSGAAKADNEIRSVPVLSNPVNQWNRCIVVSENGRVSVTINDTKVGEVTGCNPRTGSIALQSEGSEVHFRKIWIRTRNGPRTAAGHWPPTKVPNRYELTETVRFEFGAHRSYWRKRNPRLLSTAISSW